MNFIERPPTFSHVQNHGTEGIQYVFLGWALLECMRWYPSLGDVILHQQYGHVPQIFRTLISVVYQCVGTGENCPTLEGMEGSGAQPGGADRCQEL